jgi:hypothetical protein
MASQPIIAEIDVAGDSVVLGPTLATDLDVTVRAERLPVSHEETTWFFVVVEAPDFEAFDRALAADPTVAAAEVFVEYPDRRSYRLTIAEDVPVMTAHVASFGDELLDLRSNGSGWRLRIRTRDRASIRDFWAFCEEHDITFSLGRIFRASEPLRDETVPIPDEDLELLETAYEAGYFDVPRSGGLEPLAEAFDVTESTMSVRIRRAIRDLVERVVNE